MAVTTKELTCVVCPAGCQITVTLTDGVVTDVTGNTCARGKKYAESEVTHPVRTLTTTVGVTGSAEYHMLPVKTSRPIPREDLMDAMAQLVGFTIPAPIHTGDILIADFIEMGCDLVACKDIL